MLNTITVQARLCDDPVLRYTTNQKEIVRVSIACQRDYVRDGGQKTDFFALVVYGAKAKFLEKYFKKGNLIIVKGRMEIDVWKDSDGADRMTPQILAENIYFGQKKEAGTGEKEQQTEEQIFTELQDDDDTLPF